MPRVLQNFIILIIASSCSSVQGDLITYKIIDGAAGDQAGHTISGTITLDPSCASTCTSLHSWEYTISGPTSNWTVSHSPDDGTFGELMVNPDGLFRATPTELTIEFGETTLNGGLILNLAGLAWENESFSSRGYFAHNVSAGQGGWFTTPSAGVVTIATAVPEPSAFCFLGLLGIGGLTWSRRTTFSSARGQSKRPPN